MTTVPCYYVPKILLTGKFRNFSIESKLLFGKLLTDADRAIELREVSQMIGMMEEHQLRQMKQEVKHLEQYGNGIVETGGMHDAV